jgi:hypothetical protein
LECSHAEKLGDCFSATLGLLAVALFPRSLLTTSGCRAATGTGSSQYNGRRQGESLLFRRAQGMHNVYINTTGRRRSGRKLRCCDADSELPP